MRFDCKRIFTSGGRECDKFKYYEYILIYIYSSNFHNLQINFCNFSKNIIAYKNMKKKNSENIP